MIWRLTYCNKDGVEARLDIIKGSSTPVEVIEGTATPFALNYKMDKPDKSGFFMTSSADISIFETTSFNIDNLKTSSETEIKVEHYINGILDWSGFVIPDFFSKTIGSPATVEMVASDRLATLKGVTLTDLNQYISMRDLAVACLAHTGLSLPLYTLADFGNDGQTNAFFKALGLSSRLSDTKGRNISCYDILKSILVASNSKLVQQDGAWHIVNKWQHEQGAGNLFSNLTSSTPYSEQTINFSDVHVGGRRSIVPVAAITGVYHEFGGGRSYPDNFDFRDFGLIPEFNFPDWTKGGTFNVNRGNKEIIGYSFDGQMQFGANTVDNYFFNSNVFNTSNYLQMDGIPVPYATGQIEVVLDLNATAQTVSQFLTNVTAVKIAVGAVKDGSPTIWLNNSGIFAEDNAVIHNLNFERGATHQAQTKGFNLKGIINNPEGYSIIMRIYGSRDEGEDNRRQIAIHFARIEFKNTQDAPKGTIYKRKQGTDFTKEHDIDTTIFGDYMQKGLDGYFYEYPFDDTSSLYRTAGTLTQPSWTAPNDTEQLPLLQHVTRQKSRMFSLAHNMISARINVSSFKPLNIFIDCNSERYVVVSATYDFLRSEVEVELEQIASTTLNVRDFIYSYFGDGESGISSVGGVSGGGGGGGGTGGGLTPEQLEILSWWKKDPDNPDTIFTEMNAYSTKELSAYGVGDGGGGGGSDYERLDTWASYDSSKAGWVLSAFLGNDLNTRVTAIDDRVTDLENSAGGGSVTSVGISVPTGLSVANSPITSSGVIAIGLQTGYSIPTTVKQGQWDTAYSNNHTHSNKTVLDGITSGLVGNWNAAYTNTHTHSNKTVLDGITSALISNWNTAYTNSHTHSNKTQLDLITQSNINVLAKLSIVNGNLQIDGNAYATGELSAYGAGTGGGGGGGIIETVYGYGNLGQTFNNTNLTDTFNAYTINQINTRLVSVENGSATTVNTTGTGNAITSISKAGSVITANKGLTFSLSNHLHTGVYLPLTGGTMANTNLVTNLNADLLDGYQGIMYLLEGRGYGMAVNNSIEWLNGAVTPETMGGLTTAQGTFISFGSSTSSHKAQLLIGKSTYKVRSVYGNSDNSSWSDLALTTSNVASASKLQTPRTIAGVSFDGTANIAIPFANLASKPTTLTGYGITDAFKTLRSVTDLDAVTESGIYRQGTPNSGFDYTTTLNLSSGDGRQQLTIARDGSAMKFRGVNSGSGTTGWTGWKTVYHSGNLSSLSQLTDNIGVANHIANTSNPHGVTTAQIGAVDLTTNQTIGGVKTFTGDVTATKFISPTNFGGLATTAGAGWSQIWGVQGYELNNATTPNATFYGIATRYVYPTRYVSFFGAGVENAWIGLTNGFANFNGTVTAPTFAASTSVTTPKVIFNAAGWSMEQVGSELQMKHNNVLKMRFTSTGTIVAINEITAHG